MGADMSVDLDDRRLSIELLGQFVDRGARALGQLAASRRERHARAASEALARAHALHIAILALGAFVAAGAGAMLLELLDALDQRLVLGIGRVEVDVVVEGAA
ncbi:MAG: hypothetical protein ACK55I_19635, partial [bacterium]